MKKKVLILLPTLNEVDHIFKLYKKILKYYPGADILFIDDASIDGSWEVIMKIKKKRKNKVFAIRRNQRKGLGKAHKDGLYWAYNKSYSYLITMDTDFAHDPKYLPLLIKKILKNDLVIGSRHLKKKSTPNWNFFRLFLNKTAYLVSYILFNHNLDSTNAFRCYNLERIKKNFILQCQSNDYDFFFTSITILNLYKYKISQIPMVIKGRTAGSSKMTLRHMIKSVYMMVNLFFKIKFSILK
jgi:dolichol-phosphate mannosyltransferase